MQNSVVGEGEINAYGESVIIGSAVLGGGDTISVLCDDTTAIDKVEIVFCGNASVAARAIEADVVGLDDVAGIITATLGKIRFTVADSEMLSKGVDAAEGDVIGFGTAAAVTAENGEFTLAYAGEEKITLAKADKSGAIKRVRETEVSGVLSDIAVGYVAARLIIAYVVDGEIAYRFSDADFAIVSAEKKTGIRADKVSVAGKDRACLIYCQNGKCFLKQFEKELSVDAKLTLAAKASLTSAEE